MTHGLVAHWPADGYALDASGFGNHGKLSGSGAIQYAAGHSGDAFAFSGQGWVEVPDAPILDPASALTLAAWVRPDTLTGADILGKDGECKNRQYVFSIGASSLRLRGHVGTASGFHNTDGKSSLQAGVWTHFAMTYDSITGELVLYVNGAVDGGLTVPAGSRCIISTPEPLRIGGGSTCGTPYPFPGRVDEARVYDRALSAAEIAALAK